MAKKLTPSSEPYTLELEALRNGIGCLEPEVTAAALSAVQAALGEAGHDSGMTCEVLDQDEHRFVMMLKWEAQDRPQNVQSWRNRQRRAEWAAEGIAFLMVEEFTPYTVVEQSEGGSTDDESLKGGSGIDYFLAYKDNVDCARASGYPAHDARLEVSGILRATEGNSLRRRVREKIKQSKKSDDYGTPAFIIVVEIGAPQVNFTERTPPDDGIRER